MRVACPKPDFLDRFEIVVDPDAEGVKVEWAHPYEGGVFA